MIVELSGEMAGNAVIGPAIKSYAETNGIPSATADRLCLVVDELAANVVMHARVEKLRGVVSAFLRQSVGDGMCPRQRSSIRSHHSAGRTTGLGS